MGDIHCSTFKESECKKQCKDLKDCASICESIAKDCTFAAAVVVGENHDDDDDDDDDDDFYAAAAAQLKENHEGNNDDDDDDDDCPWYKKIIGKCDDDDDDCGFWKKHFSKGGCDDDDDDDDDRRRNKAAAYQDISSRDYDSLSYDDDDNDDNDLYTAGSSVPGVVVNNPGRWREDAKSEYGYNRNHDGYHSRDRYNSHDSRRKHKSRSYDKQRDYAAAGYSKDTRYDYNSYDNDDSRDYDNDRYDEGGYGAANMMGKMGANSDSRDMGTMSGCGEINVCQKYPENTSAKFTCKVQDDGSKALQMTVWKGSECSGSGKTVLMAMDKIGSTLCRDTLAQC